MLIFFFFGALSSTPSRHVMLDRDTNLSHFHPRKTHLDSKTQSSCFEMDTQMPGYI